ncbi:MAG: hypothetical protein WC603_02280 [Candidatus Paceibacterota bacterium]|jgi:uncharacterized membrane protein
MLSKIILNLLLGFIIGFLLEFTYRSFKTKKIIIPKLINYQMYGITGAFLVFIYFLDTLLIIKLIAIFLFPTIIEFTTGYLYLKIKKTFLWDYFKEPFNFMGLVCPLFSVYWFVIAITYYYLILPLTL